MTEALKGLLHGNVITLDAPVPKLEGKRVLVLLEPIGEPDAQLTSDAQAQLWQAWVEHGPQGPIGDEEDESEFPL